METTKYVIGLDYGTDSARAVLVNANNGEVLAQCSQDYPRWKKGLYCNPQANQWRQHPSDYIEVLETCVKGVLAQSNHDVASQVVGIAFDTTGSTPAFTDESGTPLALLPEFQENPNAMFVLWKDHTAIREAQEINQLCQQGEVNYAMYEGGIYSAEWLWAKALHILRTDAKVAANAYSMVECCEWLPAMLTGVKKAKDIVRSRCAEGHKAMWHEAWGGLPPEVFLTQLDPQLAGFRDRLFNQTETADKPVGTLCKEWAERLGLGTDVVVAGGAFDCHVGAVGAGIAEHTLVRVIGTSTCDVMVASPEELGDKCIRGICGQVDGSVIPGLIGLEAGQSSFGDVYAMFKHILEYPIRQLLPNVLKDKMNPDELDMVVEQTCGKILRQLDEDAGALPPSTDAMVATDWINGRRTPDSNPLLKGTLAGLTLSADAPKVYRALVEATAFGTKAIMDRMEQEGLHIDNVIGIGGIALKSPFVMQTMCDVLNRPIKVCNTAQACALGAAMFAATAAGIYPCVQEAIAAMSPGFRTTYHPDIQRHATYQTLYEKYVALGTFTEKHLFLNK